MIVTRVARPTDLPALMLLENSSFSPPWTESMFLEELNSADACVLAAELAAEEAAQLPQLVGFAVFHLAGDQTELYQIVCAADLRRRGVARLLLQEGEKWMRSRESSEVFLEVRASNGPAIALYESQGFTLLGRRKQYYSSPVEDALLYEKTL